jgi:hypothetical protein
MSASRCPVCRHEMAYCTCAAVEEQERAADPMREGEYVRLPTERDRWNERTRRERLTPNEE